MSFLSSEQLQDLGLGSYGSNVLISRKASIYNPGNIYIGDNVRIDDFCILSPGIDAKFVFCSYIHIGCFSLFIGGSDICMGSYSGVSSYVGIYSSTDDFSGAAMTNPMINDRFRRVRSRRVDIGDHVIIGTKATILPGASLDKGCAILAHSLVHKKVPANTIYSGVPAVYVRERSLGFLEMEKQFINSLKA